MYLAPVARRLAGVASAASHTAVETNLYRYSLLESSPMYHTSGLPATGRPGQQPSWRKRPSAVRLVARVALLYGSISTM
ncbi:hypothetical protein D3C76_1154460 [compost metagenome]